MIDFYIQRNMKNVMFNYMPVVMSDNIWIDNEHVKTKQCRFIWDLRKIHPVNIISATYTQFNWWFVIMFTYDAILDSSFKWSIVASATTQHGKCHDRTLHSMYFHTRHVVQPVKVNMNMFTNINIMFTFRNFRLTGRICSSWWHWMTFVSRFWTNWLFQSFTTFQTSRCRTRSMIY